MNQSRPRRVLRTASTALVLAVMTLSSTGCVAAPPLSSSGGGSVSQSGSVSTCPATMNPNQDSPLGFNTTTGRSLVDPSTTQILVCRYVSSVGPQGGGWDADAKGVLTGRRSAALVTQVNVAPTAKGLMRCPSSMREELWFFETGATVTAELWVMLDGCGFASDATHLVRWAHGDPLTG